jgi:uncharacterized protein
MTGGDWLKPSSGRILIEVKAIPGAARSEVAGLRDGALLVRVAAPPERGKANEELRACLAKALGLAKTEIEIVAGAGSRRKRISIPAECESSIRELAARSRGD